MHLTLASASMCSHLRGGGLPCFTLLPGDGVGMNDTFWVRLEISSDNVRGRTECAASSWPMFNQLRSLCLPPIRLQVGANKALSEVGLASPLRRW